MPNDKNPTADLALVRLFEKSELKPEASVRDYLSGLLVELDKRIVDLARLKLFGEGDPYGSLREAIRNGKKAMRLSDARDLIRSLILSDDGHLVFKPPRDAGAVTFQQLCELLLGSQPYSTEELKKDHVKLIESIRQLDDQAAVLLQDDLAFRAARRLLVYRPVNDIDESLTLPLLAVSLSLDSVTEKDPSNALKDVARLTAVRAVLLTGRDGPELPRPRIDRVHLPARPGAYIGSMGGLLEPDALVSVWRMQTEQVWGWLSALFGCERAWHVAEVMLDLAARVCAAEAEIDLFPVQVTLAEAAPADGEGLGRIEVELVPADQGKRGNGPLRALADLAGFVLIPASKRLLSKGAKAVTETSEAFEDRRKLLASTLKALPLVSIRNSKWEAGTLNAYDARDGSSVWFRTIDAKPIESLTVAWSMGDGAGTATIEVQADSSGLTADNFSADYSKARQAFLEHRKNVSVPFPGLPSDAELPDGLSGISASLYRSFFIADTAGADSKTAPVRRHVVPFARTVGAPGFTFDDGLFVLLSFAMVGQEQTTAGSFRRLAGAWSGGATASEVPLPALYALEELGQQEAESLNPRRATAAGSTPLPPRLPIRGIYLRSLTSALASAPLLNTKGSDEPTTVTAWASSQRKRIVAPLVEDMLKQRTLQTIGSVIYALGGEALGGMPEELRRFAKAWRNLDGFDQDSQEIVRSVQSTRVDKVTPMAAGKPDTNTVLQVLKGAGFTTARHLAMSSPPEIAQLFRNCLPEADHSSTGELALTVYLQTRHAADSRKFRAQDIRSTVKSTNLDRQPLADQTTGSVAPETAAASPDLQRLFGSLDVCECDEDASVYGAPAYLVDMFEFLRFRSFAHSAAASTSCLSPAAKAKCCGTPDPQNALEVLLQRRPDLEHLDLSSINTQRLLPYIDLVNEVLEAAIAGDRCTLGDLIPIVFTDALVNGQVIPQTLCKQLRKHGVDVSESGRFTSVSLPKEEGPCREVLFLRDRNVALRFQRDSDCAPWTITRLKNSTRSESALAAEPEYINAEVYQRLSAASSGYALPFSLATLQIKSYLSMAEVQLADVDLPWCNAKALNGSDSQAGSADSQAAASCSSEQDRLRRAGLALGIPWPVLRVICGEQSDAEFWYWANGKASGELTARAFLRGIRRMGERPQFGPLSTLCRAAYTGGSGAVGLRVDLSAGGKDCSTDKLDVHWSGDQPAEIALQPVSRLLRLFHALGSNSIEADSRRAWTIPDIDQAIAAPGIGGGRLDLGTLEGIRDINTLSRRFPKVPRAEWLSMFGMIHHAGFRNPQDSLYWRQFLDPVRTQQNELSAAYAFFLPANIDAARGKVADRRSDLAMRLGIATEDLESLVKQLRPEHGADAMLTHALLSSLFANCRMRHLLSLDWTDWLAWRRLFLQASKRSEVFESPGVVLEFLSFYDLHRANCALRPVQLERALTGYGSRDEPFDPQSLLPKDGAVLAALKAIASDCSSHSTQAIRIWAERTAEANPSNDVLEAWWQTWLQANPQDRAQRVALARAVWAELSSLSEIMAAARAAAVVNPGADPDRWRELPQADDLALQGNYFLAFEQALGEHSEVVGGTELPSRAEAWGIVEPLWRRVLTWAGFGGGLDPRIALVRQAVIDLEKAQTALAQSLAESAQRGDAASMAEASLHRAQTAILYLLQAPLVATKLASARTDSVLRALAPISTISPALLPSVLRAMQVENNSALDLFVSGTSWKEVSRQLNSPNECAEINSSGVFVPTTPEFDRVWLTILRLVRTGRLMGSVKLDDEMWRWVLSGDGPALLLLNPLDLPGWSLKYKKDAAGRIISVLTEPAPPSNRTVVSQWMHLLNIARLMTELPAVEPSPGSGQTIAPWKILRAALQLRAETNGDEPPGEEQVERAVRVLCTGIDMLISAPRDSTWEILRINWNDTKPSSNVVAVPISVKEILERLLDSDTFDRVRALFAWQQRSGLPLPLIHALCRTPDDEEMLLGCATRVRDSLKPRFAEVDWFGNLKASMNRVREAKRDALVAYLVSQSATSGRPAFASAKALYRHYLIDVEKSALESTSRIVQAHATVQLFVNRCLMGQEPQVQIPSAALRSWQPWEWMKNFRVWQAARKIFLYPENWLYPELRDDRSVFFRELQAELSQNKLDKRTVQDAVANYLRKLNEVSRLEVVSSFNEVVGASLIVHVVARTRTEPRAYFYRQWVDQSEWTPWERIEVEINGEQVLVFARSGRVHLAWLTADRKPRKKEFKYPAELKAGGTVPAEQQANESAEWHLRIALSENIRGSWSPKRVSPTALVVASTAQSDEGSIEELKRLQLVYEGESCSQLSLLQFVDASERKGWKTVGVYALSTCSGHADAVSVESDATVSIYPAAQDSVVEHGRFFEVQRQPGSADSLVLLEGVASAAAVDQLQTTPGRFALAVPRQASLLDFTAGAIGVAAANGDARFNVRTVGAWLPAFYSDDASVDILVDHADIKGLQILLGGLADWALEPESEATLRKAFTALAARIDRGVFNDEELVDNLSGLTRVLDSRAWIPRLSDQIQKAMGDEQSRVELYPGRMIHPEACSLVRIASGHLDRWWMNLYARSVQATSFSVRGRRDEKAIAFNLDDGYASYNWEVFVHIPLLLAQRFVDAGDFEGAFRCFKMIFNPLAAVQRTERGDEATDLQDHWITRPFHEHTGDDYDAQRIDLLLDPNLWKQHHGEAAWDTALAGLYRSVKAWRSDPANPYQVARHRWVAMQKAVVYRLISMLTDWGDSKFRLYERESLTEATQLYEMASDLLGDRPIVDVPAKEQRVFSYEEIRVDLDKDNDALLDAVGTTASKFQETKVEWEEQNAFFTIYNDHFCIPQNDELIRLWDRVEDRLYKLRHSQDIDGVERILALFSPPIDPGALVRARGSGLNLSEVLAGLSQPLPHHRFKSTWDMAMEFARELRTLGGQLQAALERKDGEAMALLRTRQDREVHEMIRTTRRLQIAEAESQAKGLEALRTTVEARQREYEGREEVSAMEQQGFDLTRLGIGLRLASQVAMLLASAGKSLPDFSSGFAAIGPLFYATTGGGNVAGVAQGFSLALSALSEISSTEAGIVTTRASYRRRKEEWTFQGKQAAAELKQIEQQITAAELRISVAQAELSLIEQQIEHDTQQLEYLKNKFTNVELYDWLARQTTGLYYRAYQLALEFARKAERCLDFEFPPNQDGVPALVGTGHWDGARRGLGAADALISDLNRLIEARAKRDVPSAEPFEVVYSLRDNDPAALLQLRTEGRCRFRLTRDFFDSLFPGHAMRRIAGHAFRIDCVAGPDAAIAVCLTLQSSRIHLDEKTDGPAIINPIPSRSDYTCTGSRHPDQTRYASDPAKYGVFEGAGAISDWLVQLPGERAFDWSTISNFRLTLWVKHVVKNMNAKRSLNPRPIMVSLRDNLPFEFTRLGESGERVPMGVGSLLDTPDGDYEPVDDETIAQVCILIRPESATAGAPKLEIRAAASDSKPINMDTQANYTSVEKERQQVRLAKRGLSSDEVKALTTGAFVNLLERKGEVVDVILLMPPRAVRF